MKLMVLLVTLALIPVACTTKSGEQVQGSTSGAEKVSAQSGQKHDPCSLVTKEEMSQATGEQYTNASAEKNSKTCTYMSADPSVASGEISSTWEGDESRAMMPAMKAGEDLTKMTPGGEAMIPGLGDQASFAMYALTVRKGDTAFMIRLNLPSRLSRAMRQEGAKGAHQYADDILAMDKVLAAKALKRL
jgi:uncharacterized protein DUF3558